jgi:ATP-dependent DNA helicase RecQ
VTAGWVDFAGGERPLARLTDAGRAVMRGEWPVRLVLPAQREARGAPARGRRRAGAAPESELSPGERDLFEALRAHRLRVASAQGVPPYVVAHDRTLRDVARLVPRSRDELLRAHGMGPAKVDRWGEGLLEVVRAHAAARGEAQRAAEPTA